MDKLIHARRLSRPLPALRMASLANMPSASNETVTTIFLSNLHCASCVQTIQESLGALTPRPTSVDVSIVTQTVTVRHPIDLTPANIKAALDAAGFDIVETPTEDTNGHASLVDKISRLTPLLAPKQHRHIQQCKLCQAEYPAGTDSFVPSGREKLGDGFTSEFGHNASTLSASETEKQQPTTPWPGSEGPYHVVLSVGGMTCASCVNTVTSALSDVHGVSDVTVNLLGNAASANIQDPELVDKLVEAVEDVGYEGEVISVEPLHRQVPASRNVASGKTREGPFRAILSIGGMTCASCSNTITRLCSEIAGVSDVAVDLIGKSASAVIEKKDLTDKLVETIEDAGYEAEVIEVSSLGNERSDAETEHIGPRTVTLKVDGMTCPHCPPNVMHTLEPFLDRITIDKPITNHTDPILRVTYTPDPPHFTIRTIIDAIASSDSVSSQKFSASICHPPSLEARARHMQAKEQRSLLLRLAFSVVVAIPTFIIAVVYMSLVPSSNHVRMWFMRPMWAGNASRIQWALLFLATPVMFYSAGIFHRRSLKELWALWTRGNTPIWKRFVRFGSMNLLVSSGVSVAYFSSIALLALAAVQPASDSEGDSTTYFDSVVFLTMFLLAGRFLEAYSKGRTADAITALGKLRPSSALLLIPHSAGRTRPSDSPNAGTVDLSTSTSSPDEVDQEKCSEEADNAKQSEIRIEAVSVDLLEVGDVVRVQHGASPPADGTVISGDAGAFDESSLTGESRLVPKAIGDKVYVGTINKGSPVDVRVDAIGGETMLDHVVKVVREGQSRRAPIERVADVLTGYFVPVVTLLAIITWIVWLALGETGALPPDYLDIDVGGWPVWSLEFAIAVFVVACPCGIGLAAPTALLVGSGLAAKFGILVRGGGEAFQEAAQLDLVVFDKTGTLTEGGEPRVTDAEFITGSDDENPPSSAALTRGVLLGIAIELESASSHPLASAIRQYCEENGVTPQIGTSFEETPGRGVKAYFELLRCVAVIGNEAWIEEHGADINGRISSTLNAWKTEGKSVILLAVREHADNSEDLRQGYTVRALFAVSDPLRPEASSVVSRLNAQGINTWMISGDNEITARAVAKMVGIAETNVIAGVLPHEKAEKIRWLQMVGMKRAITGWRRLLGFRRLNGRCIVAMVGDGINDAPALTAADVGIAIGSGSDVALSSASFILVSSDLRSLLTLADLSRRVFNRVKFNFLWATVYNIIALPIAAGVVYPAGHARLSPVWASLAMALSSVSVVTSSLLLRLYKEPASPRA